MNQWLLLTLIFVACASLTRLVNSDKLLAPLRGRVEEYWSWQELVLLRENSAGALVHKPDYFAPQSVREMKAEVYRRAMAGEDRWRKAAWKLDWYETYRIFLSCPWCVGMWVFGAGLLLGWWLVLGAPWTVWGGPWWVTVPCLTLGMRWIYGLTASNLDD